MWCVHACVFVCVCMRDSSNHRGQCTSETLLSQHRHTLPLMIGTVQHTHTHTHTRTHTQSMDGLSHLLAAVKHAGIGLSRDSPICMLLQAGSSSRAGLI